MSVLNVMPECSLLSRVGPKRTLSLKMKKEDDETVAGTELSVFYFKFKVWK